LVALDECIIEGIHTNIEMHRRLLTHPAFLAGEFSTKFLEYTDIFADEQG
jgi:acetyl-CoA carboxylase biotin carboxylase subunit